MIEMCFRDFRKKIFVCIFYGIIGVFVVYISVWNIIKGKIVNIGNM